MGGTQNLKMAEVAKEIWEYFWKCGISITPEYLPSELNVAADWESQNNLDSSERMLSHQNFLKVCQINSFSEIDLFASRLSHQIPTHVHVNQILRYISKLQMHLKRIGHTNSCILFLHVAGFQNFSTKHSRYKFQI